jgi:hypothetical protein
LKVREKRGSKGEKKKKGRGGERIFGPLRDFPGTPLHLAEKLNKMLIFTSEMGLFQSSSKSYRNSLLFVRTYL